MQRAEDIAGGLEKSQEITQNRPVAPTSRRFNPWWAMVALMFGLFMALLDVTIVNIALTDIQTRLNTDLTTVSWVLNAYNLGFAVLLITMGRFADQFGRKRIFMLGMAIFSIGSFLCAISPSIGWLIGFRAFQSIGAASINPVSLAIITNLFPREKRGAAIGIWGAMAGLATAVGPLLGGFLVQNFDWRWIFYVNLPFCLIGLAMVYFLVPESRDEGSSHKIDVPGLLALSIAMFCLVLAIIQGNPWGWTSLPILALFGATIVALALFVLVELRQEEPIIDFSLFKIRSFTVTNLSIFLFGIAIQGAFLILVLYFMNARGDDPLQAAYATLPIPLASLVVSAISSRISNLISPKIMGIVGIVLLAIGLSFLYLLPLNATYFDTAWRGVLIGIGVGLCFTSFPNISLSEVPRNKLGVGSGIFNTFRQLGFTLGVAILISLFSGRVGDNVKQAKINSIAIVQADKKLPPPLSAGIVSGLRSSSQSSVSGNGSGNSSQFNLPALADRIPNGQFLKPELANLQTQISNEFQTAITDAFKFTWATSAIVAVLALIPAFLTPVKPVSRKLSPEEVPGHV